MQSSVETFSELQIHNVTMNMVKNISKKPIKSKIELPTRKTRMSQTRNTFFERLGLLEHGILPFLAKDLRGSR